MKARVVAFLGVAALIYGWACNPLPAPMARIPSAEPSIGPMVGRAYTFTQAKGTLKFQVEAVEGDTVTYSLAQNDTVNHGLKVKRTNGVYWVLAAPNPVTQDIASYPEDQTYTDVGTFKTHRVNVNVDHVYWFAQGIPVKALDGTVITTLTAIE